jgi:hypothetical protein
MTVGTGLIRALAIVASVAAASPGLMSTARAAKPEAKQESPFACSPSALSPVERKQHFQEFGPRLRALCQEVQALPNGYKFAFAQRQDTYRLLAEWMFQERRCCPFFDLSLRLDREGGPMWLELTGREGVKEFIKAEFVPWFVKSPPR